MTGNASRNQSLRGVRDLSYNGQSACKILFEDEKQQKQNSGYMPSIRCSIFFFAPMMVQCLGKTTFKPQPCILSLKQHSCHDNGLDTSRAASISSDLPPSAPPSHIKSTTSNIRVIYISKPQNQISLHIILLLGTLVVIDITPNVTVARLPDIEKAIGENPPRTASREAICQQRPLPSPQELLKMPCFGRQTHLRSRLSVPEPFTLYCRYISHSLNPKRCPQLQIPEGCKQ